MLVVAEVALALVLLVSAGLLWRGLNRLFAINPGFNASLLLTMQVQASDRRFNVSFVLAGLGTFSNFFGAFGNNLR